MKQQLATNDECAQLPSPWSNHVALALKLSPSYLLPIMVAVCVEASATAAPQGFPKPLFRTIDGSVNNSARNWGRVHRAMRRAMGSAYGDGIATPAGAARKSPREISNLVAAQPGSRTSRRGVSDFFWQWGQFLDHDIVLTDSQEPEDSMPILVPKGDLFFDPASTGQATIQMYRSKYVLEGPTKIRQQINAITAFIDASQVYGSDVVRANALRAEHGFLKTSAGDLLPFNTPGLENAPTAHSDKFFLAGDVRANEQVGLTALHTLFVREHNQIVRTLLPLGMDAELNYQLAKLIVTAEIQAITYNEFLPLLLGPDALPRYRGYRSDVDPTIANCFATAAYRFGHSMLSPTIRRIGADGRTIAAGDLGLKDAFFAPTETITHGIDPVLRGLASQRAQEIDPYVVDDVRNFLFGQPGSDGFDLVSLNIQRGRDHGLPSYNTARRALGLRPATRFADITSDSTLQTRLATAYRTVDDVDLWVGGLAEDKVTGAMVGPVFHRILTDQFRRLRDGDRYWYQTYLPLEWALYVDRLTLSQIIRNNTSIKQIQSNVFLTTKSRPDRPRR